MRPKTSFLTRLGLFLAAIAGIVGSIATILSDAPKLWPSKGPPEAAAIAKPDQCTTRWPDKKLTWTSEPIGNSFLCKLDGAEIGGLQTCVAGKCGDAVTQAKQCECAFQDLLHFENDRAVFNAALIARPSEMIPVDPSSLDLTIGDYCCNSAGAHQCRLAERQAIGRACFCASSETGTVCR